MPELMTYAFELDSKGRAFMDRLVADTGRTRDEVIVKALTLYRLAVNAKLADKAVGYAESADWLEGEWTGFARADECPS